MLWQTSLCITLYPYFSPHLGDISRNKVMKLEALPYVILNSLGCVGEVIGLFFLTFILEIVPNLMKSCGNSMCKEHPYSPYTGPLLTFCSTCFIIYVHERSFPCLYTLFLIHLRVSCIYHFPFPPYTSESISKEKYNIFVQKYKSTKRVQYFLCNYGAVKFWKFKIDVML